jgi:hypothetical protein
MSSIDKLDDVDVTTLPYNFQTDYNAWPPAAQTNWRRDRFRAKHDHIFLGTDVLGMDFQENPHRLLFEQFLPKNPGTDTAYSDLDQETKKRMILWPRGLFKTSSVVVEIVQTILNYPNIRICFLTGGDQLAKRQLARAKRVFERPTKRFEALFPEFCGKKCTLDPKTNQWVEKDIKLGNAHEFTIPCRTNTTFAEPTFAISTAKSVKAGSHFDLIVIDDLVNEQNYRSVKLLEKCYQDYLDICPLLEPTGYIIMTGTRYSYGDTYERIQEMAKVEEKEFGRSIWKFSIRDCWSLECRNCNHDPRHDGYDTDVYHDKTINIIEPPCTKCACRGFEPSGVKGVLFPATRTKDGRSIGHTLEFLEGERIRLGGTFFACQYENSPLAEGSQTFTEALLGAQTLHHPTQIPAFDQAYSFIVGDLAYVGQEDRDFSVLFMCRLFKGQIFIYECEFGNWDSGAVAENLVVALLKHRPAIMYLEKFNGWEAYDTIIAAHAATRGVQKMPIVWLKGSQAPKAKLTRIGAVKGVLQSRRLWLYSAMKGYDRLVQQLLKWPKLGRHDDFADVAGMVVAVPTGYQNENPPVVASATNWLRKLSAGQPLNDDYPDTGGGSGLVCG